MRNELRLNIPKDMRIHPLAMAIWQAGVRPDSWAMQCGPDFDTDVDGCYRDRSFFEAGVAAARKLQHDSALAHEILRARDIFAAQGKVLTGFEEQALVEHLESSPTPIEDRQNAQ